jgi:PD-(D/E)XK nuclease superfamily
MRLITTEAQRHREIEDGKDPRTSPVIGAAIEIHRNLGPGLLESAYELLPVHEAQLLTYLRLTGKRVGLLISFNVPFLTQGIVRRVL